jgi:transcriptional regulator with XRE-family HTH domain
VDTSQLWARTQWIQKQRKRLGWSQETLAKKLGVMVPEYVAYEEGKVEFHEDIDFGELKFYLDHQVRHKLVEGDEKVHMDRFEK